MRNNRNTNREEGGEGEMSVREAGKKGGETVKKKYGPEFYHEIGTKGGHKVRELVQRGKEEEGEGEEEER